MIKECCFFFKIHNAIIQKYFKRHQFVFNSFKTSSKVRASSIGDAIAHSTATYLALRHLVKTAIMEKKMASLYCSITNNIQPSVLVSQHQMQVMRFCCLSLLPMGSYVYDSIRAISWNQTCLLVAAMCSQFFLGYIWWRLLIKSLRATEGGSTKLIG